MSITPDWRESVLLTEMFWQCSIPGTLNTLGAIGGGIIVVGWGVLVTWLSVVMGDFRQNHPEVHNSSSTFRSHPLEDY